jgi:predicted Rossmann fold flavoprotein
MRNVDVLILGAGAAGMFCAVTAARRGRSVAVLDHARAPGEKIRISGGGRCNFTNLQGDRADRYLSANPRFAISALSRFTPRDFLALIEAEGIAWHEKALGQLFCDGQATRVVRMLTRQMAEAGAELHLNTTIRTVGLDGVFAVETDRGNWQAPRLVVATGGKSIPKMGASGLGYRIAADFGLPITETRPALVPLTFDEDTLAGIRPFAGVAVEGSAACNGAAFSDGLLFTHRGLSGPSILQISSYWREGDALAVDLAAGRDIAAELATLRSQSGRIAVATALARILPERLAATVAVRAGISGRLADQTNAALARLGEAVHRWHLRPLGSEGYRTAEVTLGGVATDALDARTMEAKAVPGLHFIGEVVDVTGWLGGYNFQWAWSSGWAAGQAV